MSAVDLFVAYWGRAVRSAGRVALLALVVGLAGLPLVSAGVRTAGATGTGGWEQVPGTQVPIFEVPGDVDTVVPPPPALNQPHAQTVTITVTYNGFTAQAQTAFQQAVDIWATQLTSSVPIVVNASMTALPNGVLGSSGPTFLAQNFPGAPQASTLYPIALANKLAGQDLAPGYADIDANFSSAVTKWYFGTGTTPAGQMNFTSVVLHELAHGLGFLGTLDVSGGTGTWGGVPGGPPTIYDRFVANGAGQSLLSMQNGSTALAAQLTSNNLYFSGTHARAANSGAAPRLYAPANWQEGSSVSHLDEATYPAGNPNSLLTPGISNGESIYDPGPIVRGIFEDMGWSTSAPSSSPTPSPSGSLLTLTTGPGGTVTTNPSVSSIGQGTVVTLTPVAQSGAVFTGWTVDGQFKGWANSLTITMNGSHAVNASFAAAVTFADVPGGQPYSQPITELAARGYLNGYGDGTYGPNDLTLRAQMAALIARAMDYGDSPGNPFTDRCAPSGPANCVDDELWNRVAELASRDIAKGYTDGATCGMSGAPCYAPRDNVLYAQVLSFITRAMVNKGYWSLVPANPSLYGGVLNGTGHEQDVTTFVAYTQSVGGVPDFPVNGGFPAWNQPTTRGWFARTLWAALNSYWGADQSGFGGYVP
jgi:hypothetical protein